MFTLFATSFLAFFWINSLIVILYLSSKISSKVRNIKRLPLIADILAGEKNGATYYGGVIDVYKSAGEGKSIPMPLEY